MSITAAETWGLNFLCDPRGKTSGKGLVQLYWWVKELSDCIGASCLLSQTSYTLWLVTLMWATVYSGSNFSWTNNCLVQEQTHAGLYSHINNTLIHYSDSTTLEADRLAIDSTVAHLHWVNDSMNMYAGHDKLLFPPAGL